METKIEDDGLLKVLDKLELTLMWVGHFELPSTSSGQVVEKFIA
jgi:hypothetical protein